jgi:APA family basic amino acid/polyamine antiporter
MRSRQASGAGLGFWMATALVIGNMIGSGIFLLPSSLAPFGGISIVGWIFTAVGAMLLALVFARLGRAYPKTGGPYAYSQLAFGDFVGFQTAWGYWINIWVGNAAIAVAFAGYLAVFWPEIGANPLLGAIVALAAIWLLTGVNALGVRAGGWVQAVTTIVKLVPLVAIGVIGLFRVDRANFLPFNASGESNFAAVTAVAALTLWAFIGLESATVPAEDVDDPERVIPTSTILGTAIAAAVYILGTIAVLGTVPQAQLAGSTAPFSDAASVIFGGWAGPLVAIGALVSTFGCLNGWILLQGQVPLAAARDGVFPTIFERRNEAGVPIAGLIISSLLVTILMATNYAEGLVALFTFAILLATLATLIPYAYAAMAELMLFATDRSRFSARNLTVDVVVALLAFGYALWAIAGAGGDVVLKGTLLFLAGIPVYVAVKWRARTRVAAPVERPRPSAGLPAVAPTTVEGSV